LRSIGEPDILAIAYGLGKVTWGGCSSHQAGKISFLAIQAAPVSKFTQYLVKDCFVSSGIITLAEASSFLMLTSQSLPGEIASGSLHTKMRGGLHFMVTGF
jgi:hypothetical protein